MIIVIDGMDGVGKETQCKLLEKKLLSEGAKVKRFSFPNYDDNTSCTLINEIKRGKYDDLSILNTDGIFKALAFIPDHYIHYNRNIKKYHEDGYICILDRYVVSNIIYNMHLIDMDNKDFIKFIETLEYDYLKLPRPDKEIILVSHPEISAKYIEKRKLNNNLYSGDNYEKIELQNQVYNNINKINTDIICVDDGEKYYSIDQIHSKILSKINMNF